MEVGKLGSNIVVSSDLDKSLKPMEPVNKDGSMAAGDYLAGLQKKFSSFTVGVGTVSQNNIPSGSRTMTIAPNVLQAMAGDPEVAAKYEEFLADYQKTAPRFERMRAANGQETVASGVFINADGTAGCYIMTQSKGGGERKTEISPLDDLLEKVQERRTAKTEQQKKLREAREARQQAEQEQAERVEARTETGVSVEAAAKGGIDYYA